MGVVYDPASGAVNKKTRVDALGYETFFIYYPGVKDTKILKVHRFAFMQETGTLPEEVDHINGDKSDNRWSNLRAATKAQNQANRKTNKNNKHGVKGLYFEDARSLWVGAIQSNGRRFKKRSKDKQVIINWLKETRNKLHKEFANHGNCTSA